MIFHQRPIGIYSQGSVLDQAVRSPFSGPGLKE